MRVIFATAAVVLSSLTAVAKPISEYAIDGWTIGAYANDSTGSFSHCATSASYRSGVTLLFAVGRDYRWSIGFANDGWQLTPGAKYEITYQIDNYRPIPATTTARNSFLTEAPLADSEALFAAFQRGRLLTVRAAGQTFQFALTSSSRALAATLSCTQQNLVAAPNNPFVTPGAASASSGTSDRSAFRVEAQAVAVNLLSAAGISGFQLTPDIPQDLAFFHAVWFAPGLIGGVSVSPSESVDQALSALIGSATTNCKGRFASAKLPSSSEAASIKTVCESDGKVSEAAYLVVRRPAGGVYGFVTLDMGVSAGPEDTTNAEQTSGRLMDASIKVIGK